MLKEMIYKILQGRQPEEFVSAPYRKQAAEMENQEKAANEIKKKKQYSTLSKTRGANKDTIMALNDLEE